jgi:hypothetical protein
MYIMMVLHKLSLIYFQILDLKKKIFGVSLILFSNSPQTPHKHHTPQTLHPQTPHPTNTASHKHCIPQTPHPTNTASHKHRIPQTPHPTNTDTTLHKHWHHTNTSTPQTTPQTLALYKHQHPTNTSTLQAPTPSQTQTHMQQIHYPLHSTTTQPTHPHATCTHNPHTQLHTHNPHTTHTQPPHTTHAIYCNLYTIILILVYFLKELIFFPLEWKVTERRRDFFENFAKQNGFDPLNPENWYTNIVKLRQLKVCPFAFLCALLKMTFISKGISVLIKQYGRRLSQALTELFPNIGLKKDKFESKSFPIYILDAILFHFFFIHHSYLLMYGKQNGIVKKIEGSFSKILRNIMDLIHLIQRIGILKQSSYGM